MSRPRSPSRRNWPEGLYQNSAGYFYYRDSDTGKSYGLGRDRTQAIAEARAAFAHKAAQESKSLLQRMAESTCPTLQDWAEEWLQKIGEKLSASTIKNRRMALRELLARCGHITVAEIAPKMVADVLEVYVGAGKLRTAQVARSAALEMFRAAEARGHIQAGRNPVAATKVDKAEPKRQRLSLEDFLAIHAAQTREWAKRSMELALLTAQRRQDVADMLRKDVVDGHLQVDQGKSGGQTKLGIPLTLRLDAVGWSLQEVVERCKTPGLFSKYLVHHNSKGGGYDVGGSVDYDTLSIAFAEARELASIKVMPGKTPPTFHEIRSLAIRLYKDQYGQEFAKILAGHQDMSTTLLYADPRDSQSKRVMVPDPRSGGVLDKF